MRSCPPTGAGSSGPTGDTTLAGRPGATVGAVQHGKYPPTRTTRNVLLNKMADLKVEKERRWPGLPVCLAGERMDSAWLL